MAVRHGYGKIAGTDALVFAYDTGDTRNSYKGEPTVNYVPGTYNYSTYAYVSSPVDTIVLNEKNKSITVKRYTITQAINTARAAIFPSGLTPGVFFTFSFKWKYNGSTTASPSVGIDASKGNPEGGANNNSFTSQTSNTVSIGNGWYLSTYIFVFSSVPTGNCMLTFGIVTGSTAGFVGETFDIYEAQFEIKNHRTQYSNGTRSSTQGLLDLPGNRTIDLSSVSFDSNAQMTFDGTNDTIVVSGINLQQNFTLEAVIRMYERSSFGIFGQGIFDTNQGLHILYNHGSRGMIYGMYANDNDYGGNWIGELNKYYHVVFNYNSSTYNKEFYANGVLQLPASSTENIYSGTGNMRIGMIYGTDVGVVSPAYGDIPLAKIYNKVLTADEVRNNYNQYRTRFNI